MKRSWRLPVALVTAVVVAEAAVFLLRPRDRDRGPDPVPVQARAYFSAAELARGRQFRTGQRWILVGQTVVGLAVLVWFVRRPPRRLTQHKRPVLAGAAVAAALSVAGGVAAVPLGVVARERAKDVGLVTQDWVGYAGDLVRGQAIGAALAGAGGALLVVGLRRFRARWWIPGAVVVVAYGAAMTYAAPVVLDPLFNSFTPVREARLREDVLGLARRAGVEVGEVLVMDASRRTTAANAYVAGLGQTKRVVLYDTLIEDFTPEQARLVVAHELGHQRYGDLERGLLWVALVAPFGMLAVALVAARLAPRGQAYGPAAVPAVVLAVALVLPVLSTVSNQLSRDVERRADAFSLRLTDDPATFVAFQRRIAVQNVSDPAPPPLARWLLGTHPTTLERIGQAEAF